MIQVAMIFAAGRGERMRPLTDHTPKPLLKVADTPLIVHQIHALQKAGIKQIVINHAWLGNQIEETLGDGSAYGVTLHYSAEGSALETAGGIVQALPLLKSLSKNSVFLAVSGDIYSDYDYSSLHDKALELASKEKPCMYLVMVQNPSFHPNGDFVLSQGLLKPLDFLGGEALTFGNIGLYDMRQFSDLPTGQKIPMSPYYHQSIADGSAFGECFKGVWENVGTPEQLARLNASLGF